MALTELDVTKINGTDSGTPVPGDTQTTLLGKMLVSILDGGNHALGGGDFTASGSHRGVALKVVGGACTIKIGATTIWSLEDKDSIYLPGIVDDAGTFVSVTGTGTLYYIYQD